MTIDGTVTANGANANDNRSMEISTTWPQFGTISVNNGVYPGTVRLFKYLKGARLGIRW